MLDISNSSVIISYYNDQPERGLNAQCVIDFYKKYFINYEIIVIDYSPDNNFENVKNEKNVIYKHFDDEFVLCEARNRGINLSTKDCIIIHDVDMFPEPEKLLKCYNTIIHEEHEMAIPYNDVIINILDDDVKMDFRNSQERPSLPFYHSSCHLDKGDGKMFEVLPNWNIGGVILFSRKHLVQCGSYNENFTGWGHEDLEVIKRLEKFGCSRYKESSSNLIHLDHSKHKSNAHYNPIKNSINFEEYDYVRKLSEKGLYDYLKDETPKGVTRCLWDILGMEKTTNAKIYRDESIPNMLGITCEGDWELSTDKFHVHWDHEVEIDFEDLLEFNLYFNSHHRLSLGIETLDNEGNKSIRFITMRTETEIPFKYFKSKGEKVTRLIVKGTGNAELELGLILPTEAAL